MWCKEFLCRHSWSWWPLKISGKDLALKVQRSRFGSSWQENVLWDVGLAPWSPSTTKYVAVALIFYDTVQHTDLQWT